MAIDWSKAPEGAQYYANKAYWKCNKIACGYLVLVDGVWLNAESTVTFSHSPFFYNDVQSKADHIVEAIRKVWPETDERINNIGLNRTTEDMGHYDEQREQHEKAQPVAPQANKYDRTIIGKYGSGKCTVDVYRVLNAFPSGSPEIDHALKKLLAPGKRGAKSELQDLKEAIQSIEARIDYLKELDK